MQVYSVIFGKIFIRRYKATRLVKILSSCFLHHIVIKYGVNVFFFLKVEEGKISAELLFLAGGILLLIDKGHQKVINTFNDTLCLLCSALNVSFEVLDA